VAGLPPVGWPPDELELCPPVAPTVPPVPPAPPSPGDEDAAVQANSVDEMKRMAAARKDRLTTRKAES